MTPLEHIAEAERLVERSTDAAGYDHDARIRSAAQATVHAQIAAAQIAYLNSGTRIRETDPEWAQR